MVRRPPGEAAPSVFFSAAAPVGAVRYFLGRGWFRSELGPICLAGGNVFHHNKGNQEVQYEHRDRECNEACIVRSGRIANGADYEREDKAADDAPNSVEEAVRCRRQPDSN